MKKRLIFKVEVEDNIIWRKIEINEDDSLFNLGCIILASIIPNANKDFVININGQVYDTTNPFFDTNNYTSSIGIYLDDFKFDKEFTMEYLDDKKIKFIITYLGKREEKNNMFPCMIDGYGRDINAGGNKKLLLRLQDNNTQINFHTNGNNTDNFDIHGRCLMATISYKFIHEYYYNVNYCDMLLAIDKGLIYYLDSENREIVREENYDNYSDEEKKHLYKLPTFEEINHLKIINDYIETIDNDIKKKILRCLEHKYFLEDFYNTLRKNEMLKKYMFYSQNYYQKIFDEWVKKNKLENVF